jgi:hypothetical protein
MSAAERFSAADSDCMHTQKYDHSLSTQRGSRRGVRLKGNGKRGHTVANRQVPTACWKRREAASLCRQLGREEPAPRVLHRGAAAVSGLVAAPAHEFPETVHDPPNATDTLSCGASTRELPRGSSPSGPACDPRLPRHRCRCRQTRRWFSLASASAARAWLVSQCRTSQQRHTTHQHKMCRNGLDASTVLQ